MAVVGDKGLGLEIPGSDDVTSGELQAELSEYHRQYTEAAKLFANHATKLQVLAGNVDADRKHTHKEGPNTKKA